MFRPIGPLWLLILILGFAAVSFATIPVPLGRWFFRRRAGRRWRS